MRLKFKMELWHKILLVAFSLLMILPACFAVGIAPAQEEVEFFPSGTLEKRGLIVNTGSNSISVELFEEDPFDIIEIDDFNGENLAPGEEREYSYKVTFPESLDELGMVAQIGAREYGSIYGINAIVEVRTQIIVVDETLEGDLENEKGEEEEDLGAEGQETRNISSTSLWQKIISFARTFLD